MDIFNTEAPVFFVAVDRMVEFERKFAALVKIAVKLDVEAPAFEVVGQDTRPRRPETDEDRERIQAGDPTYPVNVWNKIRFTGEAPQVPGFRFVGSIEPSEVEGINYVNASPAGEDLDLTPFAKTAIECDHCNTRRARKAAYLIHSEDTNKIFRVGKSCLKDFTGHKSPESVASFYDRLVAIVEDGWEARSERVELAWSLEGFVSMTAAVIGEFGWQTASGDCPTKGVVVDALEQAGAFSSSANPRFRVAVPKITDEHKATAAAAIEWARTLSPDPVVNTNDYLRNLRLAVEADFVTLKRVGLVASVLGAFTRAQADEIKKTERAADKEAAAPIPEFDGRVRIEGTIIAANWKTTDFGDVLKITIRHADGWKVNGSCPSAISDTTDSSALIGLKIEFDARVTVSKDDPKFGFYKRPTKVSIEHPPTTGEEVAA